MSNFDLSNQNNDEVNEGFTSNNQNNNNYSDFTNKYDDDGLTTAPVNKQVEEVGSLSTPKPSVSTRNETTSRPRAERTPKPRTERTPRIKCPSCGSHDIKYVTRTKEEDKNWGVICLWFIFFWPVGVYKALKSSKKTYQVKQCQDCGREF